MLEIAGRWQPKYKQLIKQTHWLNYATKVYLELPDIDSETMLNLLIRAVKSDYTPAICINNETLIKAYLYQNELCSRTKI